MADEMTEMSSGRSNAVDVEICAREPIHIPGAIQPFGILLVVQRDDFVVLRASRNTDAAWSRPAEAIIGRKIGELFDTSTSRQLMEWLPTVPERPATAADFDAAVPESAQNYRPIAHQIEDGWILELEQMATERPASIAGVLHQSIDRLQDAVSIDALAAAAADQVRAITGFDSIMVYRFDADWHGEVIAQSRADHMASYAGHHFPASDIPEQARQLYTVNLSRIIVDVDYDPAAIEPAKVNGEPIDLTHSVLRSVSPVHIQYLRNMDVKASMSISIVVDGRLWGLIACHHASPRHVSIETRVACELLARVMSMLASNLKKIKGRTHTARLASAHNRLMEAMIQREDFEEGLLEEPQVLLELAGAAGAAIVRGDSCRLVGQTPQADRIVEIAQWLTEGHGEEVTYSTEALATEFEPASDLPQTAAGLLAVRLSMLDSSYILWFRPELPRSIDWAGEPSNAMEVDHEGGKGIRPRKSFETWTEIQRGHSKPWLAAEREAASELRAAVTDVVMSRTEEIRQLNKSLAEANEELSNRNRELRDMAYMTTHDLQEPLRKIRAFADLLQREEERALSSDGMMFLERLMAAAGRMSALVSDLLLFSNVVIDARPFTRLDLNAQLQAALTDLRESGLLSETDVVTDQLPGVEGDPSQIRQLFQNVLENALKFRHPDRSPVVSVHSEHLKGSPAKVRVSIKDNGIGIDESYLESIFEPFHQLHQRDRFEGTGMGLAICRRIVERHGGTITAESEVGVGTRILIDLPLPS